MWVKVTSISFHVWSKYFAENKIKIEVCLSSVESSLWGKLLGDIAKEEEQCELDYLRTSYVLWSNNHDKISTFQEANPFTCLTTISTRDQMATQHARNDKSQQYFDLIELQKSKFLLFLTWNAKVGRTSLIEQKTDIKFSSILMNLVGKSCRHCNLESSLITDYNNLLD